MTKYILEQKCEILLELIWSPFSLQFFNYNYKKNQNEDFQKGEIMVLEMLIVNGKYIGVYGVCINNNHWNWHHSRDKKNILEFKTYKELGDQINANKILQSSAIDININMKITKSLCKKLLMIKGVIFIHL